MAAPDRSRPVAECTAAHSSRPPASPGSEPPRGSKGSWPPAGPRPSRRRTKIHLLQWVDFIPEGDVECDARSAEYSKQTKVEVMFETINANDLQARITAAIQSGSGPDIIMMLHNWPHLYAGGLADVCDLARVEGRPIRAATTRTRRPRRSVGKRWLGLPYSAGAPLIAYRKSWFAEAGYRSRPRRSRSTRSSASRSRRRASRRPDARPHLRRRAGLDLSVHLELRRR